MKRAIWRPSWASRACRASPRTSPSARNILLAKLTGCHLHLLHISTAGTVDLLRRAKADGIHVTGEACPHHWALTDAACEASTPTPR